MRAGYCLMGSGKSMTSMVPVDWTKEGQLKALRFALRLLARKSINGGAYEKRRFQNPY